MKTIIYCRDCDHRYEMLDGEMECMYHECMTVKPDDYCAWGERGDGLKKRKRTKEEEEEYQKWVDSLPKVAASSTMILTDESLEQLKAFGMAWAWKGEEDERHDKP